jgi:hypothetical protein
MSLNTMGEDRWRSGAVATPTCASTLESRRRAKQEGARLLEREDLSGRIIRLPCTRAAAGPGGYTDASTGVAARCRVRDATSELKTRRMTFQLSSDCLRHTSR